MSVSANQVKELREKTGAGMMDCKKALEESSEKKELLLPLKELKKVLMKDLY